MNIIATIAEQTVAILTSGQWKCQIIYTRACRVKSKRGRCGRGNFAESKLTASVSHEATSSSAPKLLKTLVLDSLMTVRSSYNVAKFGLRFPGR